ncbi:MAG: penicillin-binding protein 2 [Alphaproteobacteria bacterium]|jgi:penicillin-binding protein 2
MKFGEKNFSKMFKRRAIFIASLKGFLFSVLGIRIWWLQVKESEKYFTLAEGNRIDVRFLLPGRGRIITHDLIPIADVKPRFNLVLIPYRVQNLDEVLTRLGQLTEISPEKIKEIKASNRHLNRFSVVVIKTFNQWQEASHITDYLYQLPGIDLIVELMRYYHKGNIFSHITGYIGAVSKEEQASDADHVLRIPHMKIGKHGIEKMSDKPLRGQAGIVKVEVNNIGLVRQELSRTEAISGQDIHLTLHHDLHQKATENLSGESGSTCLINVRSGAVLAMASTPGYDPNLFIDGISHNNWNMLRLDEKAPMNNKAITGLYPAGSTFKMITLIAALESGAVSSDDKFFCSGHFTLGKSRIHCWRRGGHGYMNGVNALKNSCDVYFYEVALKTGVKKISEVARRYGLGLETGITLPYEKSGLIPTPEWKQKRYGRDWTKGDTVNMSIGQGSVLVTPLQLAVMSARIATDRMVKPILLQSDLTDVPFDLMPNINAEVTALARQGMYDVVNGIGGTARSSAIKASYGKSAGKTGTAQVRRITMSERRRGVIRNNQLPWKFRDHALYVAYAPFDNPLFAVATVVAHGGSGSKDAAPKARDTLNHAFEVYGKDYGINI